MMPVKCWSSLSCVSRFSRSINLHLSRPHTGPLTSTPTSATSMMRFMFNRLRFRLRAVHHPLRFHRRLIDQMEITSDAPLWALSKDRQAGIE